MESSKRPQAQQVSWAAQATQLVLATLAGWTGVTLLPSAGGILGAPEAAGDVELLSFSAPACREGNGGNI